jgi:protoporphyrinogen oxidase
MTRKLALIIGGGPAGLTAALELLERSDFRVIVLQRDGHLGGIARTVQFKGNRLDVGGHRFFSKSDRVMDWWLRMIPLQSTPNPVEVTYQRSTRLVASNPTDSPSEDSDRVMLVRRRKSRVLFLRQFFEYPIALSQTTLWKLGPSRTARILISYLRAFLRPIKPEKNLEEFFINRFGRELYQTFFKSYTEKVWGIACREINAEWGRQRIKGLSIANLLRKFVPRLRRPKNDDLSQKDLETSLIERFLYPKLGPGQLWEEVGRKIVERGGEIRFHHEVDQVSIEGNQIQWIEAVDRSTGRRVRLEGDYIFSTMAVQDWVRSVVPSPPAEVMEVSEGLIYRDFITVGLLVSQLRDPSNQKHASVTFEDNWIYVQESDVQLGRIQIFNNWSPSMVVDQDQVWLGLEYFCFEHDPLWQLDDQRMIDFAVAELVQLGLIKPSDFRDGTVIRERKAYPAYYGSYDRFSVIRDWMNGLGNFFPIGRNGMHRYNNQDHSMLTAMVAVDNILEGRSDKSNLWEVNTEQDYQG